MTTVPSLPRSGAGDEPASDLGGQPIRAVPAVKPAEKPLPARLIATGLAGTVLIAVGGIGAAAVLEPDPILNGTAFGWLGYGHGKQMATAVVFVGVTLLVLAWIRLGREARAGRLDRRGVLVAIAFWVLPLLLAPPLFSRDLFSYLAQGDLALHGFDPYSYGVSVLNDHLSANVDPAWQNTMAPYGPLFVLVAKAVVLVTGQSTIVGVLAMRATMCVGLVLLCWALPRLATQLGGRPTVALWFGAANPLVLVYLVGGGHNDLLMTGLLTAGTVLVLDRRYRRGIALVTLAFAVKATAGVLLPFLVWIWMATMPGDPPGRRFVRAAGQGVAVALATFAACSALAGVGLGWIPALSATSSVIEWLSLPTAAGQLTHTVASLFTSVDPEGFLSVARGIGWLVLIALVGRQWWLARDGMPATTIRRAAVALLVVTLFSPATLPWYFSWPLLLAAGLAWSRRGLVVGAFASVWIVLVTFPDGTTGLYDWAYLAMAMLAAALAAVSLVRPDPLRLSALATPRAVREDSRTATNG
ncbi:MAG TPA: polyprenol phosphomannose-dependent alpha 1,6 mannosyltransferase MptB [Pseudonocardiaceae bacterium]|jgi:alpha-1,6-mannosyltransferase|nr:polyprenol phosphomannose-dependent alpha 1,6 mannosyltransferase MptB [Pseudonocardiaceae bacterium]